MLLNKDVFSPAARPLSREITMSQAYQNMCAGMYKVSVHTHTNLSYTCYVSSALAQL